jgi:hypothetical protein
MTRSESGHGRIVLRDGDLPPKDAQAERIAKLEQMQPGERQR